MRTAKRTSSKNLILPDALLAEAQRQGSDFIAHGIVGSGGKVYPLGFDTKVLSTIFENFVRPLLVAVADKYDYSIHEAGQTVYRRPSIQYTLGSYTSFLRNGKKNILYPYDQYTEHWIVGFAYTRGDLCDSRSVCQINDYSSVPCPYSDVEWFVQEKYKIAGESPGSGNTANIGSIRSVNIEDFRRGTGPFAEHGEMLFREYWAHFGKNSGSRMYTDVASFLANQRKKSR